MTPMQLGVTLETQIFLLACIIGAGLGAIFDCLRVFRVMIKHNNVMVFIEDFAYTLFFGAVFFIFAIAQANQLRFFMLVGMLLGALVERAMLGNIVVFIVRKITEFIWRFLLSPVVKFIDKSARYIGSEFVKKYPIFKKRKKISQKVLKV